jgi:hypothetical protein
MTKYSRARLESDLQHLSILTGARNMASNEFYNSSYNIIFGNVDSKKVYQDEVFYYRVSKKNLDTI